MMMRLTADDVEPPSLPAGIIPRRGTMALSAADTCRQGRQIWDPLISPKLLELKRLIKQKPLDIRYGKVPVLGTNIITLYDTT